jgi:hypothetical protein
MWKRFWTVAIAFLFIISLASIVDAQNRRPNPNRNGPGSNNSNNGNQGEDPGNGNQGEDPGNQGQDQGNGNQGENPGNQGENPGNQGEDPGNQGEDPGNDPSGGTPDGQTPAEEDICDVLKHTTGGLYGLCVAFCEAQDSECVPDYNADNPYAGCKMRDRRILDNYNRKKKVGDPDMPCLPSAGENPEYACPCWGQDRLQYFPFYLQSWNVDETYTSFGVGEDQSYYDEDDNGDAVLVCEQSGSYLHETSILSTGEPFYFDLFVTTGDCDGMLCGGAIGCYGDGCPSDLPTYGWFSMEINPDEYENCQLSIQQLIASY